MEIKEKSAKVEIESSIIRSSWSVLGYSFVGFISLVYGVVLQYQNLKDDFYLLINFDEIFKFAYVMYIAVIVVYNLLFCHAHASLNVRATSVDKVLYTKLGHWLETIFLVVFLYFSFWCLQMGDIGKKAFAIMILISVPWCMTIIFYRTFLKFCKESGYDRWKRVKYMLLIPSILLVASNIFVGSSIGEMWLEKNEYVIVYVALPLFVFIYCFGELFRFKVVAAQNEKSILDKYFPLFFYAILIAGAIVIIYQNHYMRKNLFYIPFRTLFLAFYVAVYLSMFEGWFLLAKEDNCKIKEWVNCIVSITPMVVLTLFPFQQFQLIYFVLFIIGHCTAWLYWEFCILKNKKNNMNISVTRGILGTITLVALILDKAYNLSVSKCLGRFIITDKLLSNEIPLTIVNMLVGSGALVFYIRVNKFEKITVCRLIMYLALAFVMMYIYPAIREIEEERILLSVSGCIFFIIFECALSYFKNMKPEEKV